MRVAFRLGFPTVRACQAAIDDLDFANTVAFLQLEEADEHALWNARYGQQQ